MPVFRWGHSWDSLGDLEREMDRLFATMSLSLQGIRFSRQYPPVNIYEDGDTLLLTAELPGVKPEELDITVASGVLTLRGRHQGPDGVADEAYRRQERPRGTWQRSLSLPDRVDESRMRADFQAGVLTLHLPRVQMAPARQIQVTDLGAGGAGDRPSAANVGRDPRLLGRTSALIPTPDPISTPNPPEDRP